MPRKEYLPENEPPKKKLISEGDLLIQTLAKKQKITNITLNQELSKAQVFEKSTEILPVSHFLSGKYSINQFTEINKKVNYLEELHFAGLNNTDVQLYLDYKQGLNYLLCKHKSTEKDALFAHIKEIEIKVNEYEQNKNKLLENIEINKRNESETLLSIKPNSVETKLLKFALHNEEKVKNIPHPIDSVKELNDELFAHLNEANDDISINKIRRKARKLANRINQSNSHNSEVTTKSNHSKWDQKEIELIEPNKIITEKKHYTCNALNYYTVKNGEIINIKDSIPQKNHYTGDRMSYEDVIKVPKFENYKIGEPTKILYLKNISTNINVNDLRQIFVKFNKNNELEIKLMSGRMKGQAFITFANEKDAIKALDELNGLIIDSKPILMDFGKGKN